MKLTYYKTTNIHLSLEDYHNAGMTPQQTKEIIENIQDPGSACANLYCSPSGLNHNWTVKTLCTNDNAIYDIVYRIKTNLNYELNKLLGKK